MESIKIITPDFRVKKGYFKILEPSHINCFTMNKLIYLSLWAFLFKVEDPAQFAESFWIKRAPGL